MSVKMCELANKDPLGVWIFFAIGTFSDFYKQEYAMESPTEIRYYVLPDGICAVRAFITRNFICYDYRGHHLQISGPLRLVP